MSSLPESYRHPGHIKPNAARSRRRAAHWWVVVPVAIIAGVLFMVLMGIIAVRMAYADTIYPRVQVAQVDLGGMTPAQAETALTRSWGAITLRDGERTWSIAADELGITFDTRATAVRAFAIGHGDGGLEQLFSTHSVAPIINVDPDVMITALLQREIQFSIAPVNAGITFVDGQVQATPAQAGRKIDVLATVTQAQATPPTLDQPSVSLVMSAVTPTVQDAAPLVETAQGLLRMPLTLVVYDPVTDERQTWTIEPRVWGRWLSAQPDPDSPFGLSLRADADRMRAVLAGRVDASFGADATRTIELDGAIQALQARIASGRPSDAVTVTVQHLPRTHTVQAGESMTSIGWDYGIPYLYIQQANNGLQSLAIGQTITIPPADAFLDLPVVPDKRIVVSISQQRARVYENGALKWDWPASTGIADSPTWTGVYQIQSHVPNAYAANWNLYMPNFMGIYQPVPNAGFTNGFHGFPTRGGGQLIWENSLGRRVTYGCILLSDANVRRLYVWAETGVVVEIVR
jgi:lipoprotein-anchoring transpeptidase ErfK/SrfK